MKQKLNDLRAARAGIIRQAEVIATLAETETRDLTDAETAEIDALIGTDDGTVVGQVAALDAQIARYVRVSSLVENLAQSTGKPPIRPEGSNDPKTMKRAEFDKLDAEARAAFMRSGGRLED